MGIDEEGSGDNKEYKQTQIKNETGVSRDREHIHMTRITMQLMQWAAHYTGAHRVLRLLRCGTEFSRDRLVK